MPNKYFVGSLSGGTWAATTSWSDTDGGPSGATAPIAGDTVYINRDVTSTTAFINVNTSIGNIAGLFFTDTTPSTGLLNLSGTASSTPGTAWTLTLPVEINVAGTTTAGTTNLLVFGNSLTGAGQLVKTGPAMLGFDYLGTAPSTWTGGMDIQAGTVYVAVVNNRLGTGPIVMGANAALVALAAARSLQNNLTVSGATVYLSAFSPDGPAYSFTTQALTLTGTTALGASSKTLNVGTGGVTLSGPVTGTAGFVKAGTGALTLSGSLASLIGTVSIDQSVSSGLVYLSGTAATSLANGLEVAVTGPASYGNNRMLSIIPSVATATYPAGLTFTGTGAVGIEPSTVATGAGYQFEAGTFTGLNGTTIPNNVTFLSPTAGFFLGTAAARLTNIATVKDLPAGVFTFMFYPNASATHAQSLIYTGSAATYSTRIDVGTANTSASTMGASIFANQASGALVLEGGVTRYEQSGARTVTLTLRGSGDSSANNAITGNITQATSPATGVLAISKADANRWVLSGANSHTGANTLQTNGGTLVAASGGATTGALGASSATTTITLNPSSTLEIDGGIAGITLTKTSSPLALAGGTLSNVAGNNELKVTTAAMTANTIFNAEAGTTLILTNSGLMSGAWNVTKTGAGTVRFNSTNASFNNYSGTNTISGGVLEVVKLANYNSNSSLGAQSSAPSGTVSMAADTTLRHVGTTADTTNRNLTGTGAVGSALTIESSGTGVGAVTLNGGTLSFSVAGAHIFALGGTNTATNTCAYTVADSGGATTLRKTGTNTWDITGSLTNTGPLEVTGGTATLGSITRTLSCNISVSDGTLSNGSATVQPSTTISLTGGTISANLTGAGKTLTAAPATTATLAPQAGHNDGLGGTTNVTSGTLRLVTETITVAGGTAAQDGRVLGTTAVTVGAGAAVKTLTGINQKGRMRYGGVFTIGGTVGNPAKMVIGGT